MARSLPLRLLLGILAVYTLLEFYPFSPSVYLIPHYIVAALCLGYLLLYPQTRFIGEWNLKPVLFLLGWLIFNLASYLWAKDQTEVLYYSLWITRYLVVFLIYSKLFTSYRWLQRFHWFIFGMVVLYVATAIWEMVTFQHLPASKFYGVIHYIPSGPFYNENNLAAFLLLFSPFLLFVPQLSSRKGLGFLSAVVIVIVTVIVVIQGARIAMLALAVFLAGYFLFQMKWRQQLALTIVLVLLSAGIYLNFRQEIEFVIKILQFQTETLGTERSSIYMSSIQIRRQLLTESFDMAARTAFIGVGGGNFEPQMSSQAASRTAGIINPHNYLMELFGNWGIVVLAGFVYIYLHWLIGLWRLWRRASGNDRTRYLMYLVSLLLFLPASILPSSIRWNYFIWIYFAAVNATLYTKPDTEALEVAA